MVDYTGCKGAMVTWERVSPMPEVLDIMPIISKNYNCAVASNAVESDAELMRQALQRIDIDKYFNLFITSKELGVKKPSPSFFNGIADKLQITTSEICMIGNDYEKDIVGAKHVGMKTILITNRNGWFPYADNVISTFGELTNIV